MNKLWFLLFVVVVAALCYYLVIEQWYLISSTRLFIVMVVMFVSLSFYCSASEAAFAKAHTDERIQASLDDEAANIAKRYSKTEDLIQSVGLEKLNREQKKNYKLTERDNKKLKHKRDSLDETSRAIYVGTFASLSVFLNIALAAILPLAMVASPDSIKPIIVHIPLPDASVAETKPGASSGGIQVYVQWLVVDLSGKKILVFLASALPILIFGKIIPKEVGSLFHYTFAYRLNRVARMLVKIFGFIPQAMSWPLGGLRILAAKTRQN